MRRLRYQMATKSPLKRDTNVFTLIMTYMCINMRTDTFVVFVVCVTKSPPNRLEALYKPPLWQVEDIVGKVQPI